MEREVKKVGNFVLQYRSRNKVAISYMGCYSTIGTQRLTNKYMEGVLTHTGAICKLPYDNVIYPAGIFKKPFLMSRKKLEDILQNIKLEKKK